MSPESITLASPGDDAPELPGWLSDFLKSIHSGETSPDQINRSYYDHVSADLSKAVAEGLGGSTFGAADYRNTLKAYIDQNVYAFSAARSLEENKLFTSFLTDANGDVVSASEFFRKVSSVGVVRNVIWLDTDRIQALTCAQAAEKWDKLQQFKMLEYRTTGGEAVCPICGGLDGLILYTDDPRWGIIFIPNHNRCQCNIVPADTDAVPDTDNRADNLIKAAKIPKAFKFNPGMQKLAYTDDYPYLEKIGTGKLSELDAERDYAMRSPEKIYTGTDLPVFNELPDRAAADKWWKEEATNGTIEIRAKDGLSIPLDNTFKAHVLDENSDDRYRIIAQAESVLTKPDEIWSNRIKGNLRNIYLKYYDDAPIVIIAEADVSKPLRAITMYQVKKDGKVNFDALRGMRKGILKHRNR